MFAREKKFSLRANVGLFSTNVGSLASVVRERFHITGVSIRAESFIQIIIYLDQRKTKVPIRSEYPKQKKIFLDKPVIKREPESGLELCCD